MSSIVSGSDCDVVLPKTCSGYNSSKNCSNPRCNYLHLCSFWVAGECNYGNGCKRNHTLLAKDIEIIKDWGFDPYDSFFWDQMKEEKQSKHVRKLPEVCSFYNKNQCTKSNCSFVHLCKDYVDGECRQGEECLLNHILTTSNYESLRNSGVEGDMIEATIKYVQNKQNEKTKSKVSDKFLGRNAGINQIFSEGFERRTNFNYIPGTSRNDVESSNKGNKICVYFLRGECTYQNNCINIHPLGKTNFAWCYKHQNWRSWKCFDDAVNLKLEASFSDPKNSTCTVDLDSSEIVVDFRTMREASDIELEFHRSEVYDHFPTKWNWYWKSSTDEWKEYGILCEHISSIDSSKIESFFQSLSPNERDSLPFHVTGVKDGAFFLEILKVSNGMPMFLQKNSSGRVKDVRRRPKQKSEAERDSLDNNNNLDTPEDIDRAKSNKGDNSLSDICDRHIEKPCSSTKCPMFNHNSTNFLWVWKNNDANRHWQPFDDVTNEILEFSLGDPGTAWRKILLHGNLVTVFFNFDLINFMTSDDRLSVKRLYYENCCPFTWYWLDVDDSDNLPARDLCGLLQFWNLKTQESQTTSGWVAFPSQSDGSSFSQIRSDEIESVFKSSSEKMEVIQFVPKNTTQFCELHLSPTECKLKHGDNMWDVCRRPSKSSCHSPASPQDKGVPSFFNESDVHLVPLKAGDKDVEIIKSYMSKWVPEVKRIRRIGRIEQRDLWDIYNIKRTALAKNFGSGSFQELVLFHGVRKEALESVVEDCFDASNDDMGASLNWKFGGGIYFTSHFQTALSTCPSNGQNENSVIVSFVSVGGIVTFDSKNNSKPDFQNTRNKCLVDNLKCPKYYVVNDKSQIYPSYVISISE